MSHDLRSGSVAPTTPEDGVGELPRLYAARFVFAVGWAGLFVLTAATLNPASVVLLVLYPLVDVAAAAVDVRTSGMGRPRGPLLVNLALSLVTAGALAVAASAGVPDVLRVWGAWAVTAGAVQVVVAIRRHRLGGQWPLVLSGGISVLAGAGFVQMAAGSDASLTGLAGYAVLGGVFFLVSAVRLRRAASAAL